MTKGFRWLAPLDNRYFRHILETLSESPDFYLYVLFYITLKINRVLIYDIGFISSRQWRIRHSKNNHRLTLVNTIYILFNITGLINDKIYISK